MLPGDPAPTIETTFPAPEKLPNIRTPLNDFGASKHTKTPVLSGEKAGAA